ncbi:MAG: dihydrofolate reductase [Bacteroidota bacterium]
MRKIIIAAKSDNNVIGKDNDLVWDLPADQRFFKEQIEGQLLLTGRTSFESELGVELFTDNPKVLVLTRQKNYSAPPAKTYASLEDAFEYANGSGVEKIFILGGQKVYEASLGLVDEIIMTEVHGIFEGDAFFPDFDPNDWEEAKREDFPSDEENAYPYSFVWYRKKSN